MLNLVVAVGLQKVRVLWILQLRLTNAFCFTTEYITSLCISLYWIAEIRIIVTSKSPTWFKAESITQPIKSLWAKLLLKQTITMHWWRSHYIQIQIAKGMKLAMYIGLHPGRSGPEPVGVTWKLQQIFSNISKIKTGGYFSASLYHLIHNMSA